MDSVGTALATPARYLGPSLNAVLGVTVAKSDQQHADEETGL